jgi:hypothetical protein
MAATQLGPATAGTTVLLKPVDIVLESGDPALTLSTGYNTIESSAVRCPSGNGCVLGLKIMSAIGKATCASSEWAIVGLVDGNSVDGGPFVDVLPNSDKTQTRNWQGEYAVAYGTHTVAFQIYVPCPATAYQWSVSYLVAKQ